MKKLLFSVVSLMASACAFAELSYENAYWIIKDGKMTDKISYWEYDGEDLETKIPSEIKDTVVDGEDVVVYKQISKDYLDARLKFDSLNTLDLSKNYVMVIEYKIPESHTGVQICEGNKPLWMFGFASTESKLKANNATKAEAYTFIDAKWGKADEWVTAYKYIYSPSSLKSLYGMNFSYAREYIPGNKWYNGELTEHPYIKNMGFVSIKEGKPFYAENFDGFGIGEFYLEKIDISKKKVVYVGGVKPVVTDDSYDVADSLGILPLTGFRDFLPDSIMDQDGSGYIDCEQLRAMQVESIRDSIVFPGIAIPDGTETIYSKMLIKKHKNENGYWADADDYSDYDLPILLRFDNGETVDLANDTIKPIWTKFEGEIKVPSGATSFDLVFKAGKAGYLVDDIMLSAQKFADVKVNQIDANAFDIVAYVDANGDIAVLNGELVASYNVVGRTATKDDKIVVIIVKNDKGQLASKVIVRK